MIDSNLYYEPGGVFRVQHQLFHRPSIRRSDAIHRRQRACLPVCSLSKRRPSFGSYRAASIVVITGYRRDSMDTHIHPHTRKRLCEVGKLHGAPSACTNHASPSSTGGLVRETLTYTYSGRLGLMGQDDQKRMQWPNPVPSGSRGAAEPAPSTPPPQTRVALL